MKQNIKLKCSEMITQTIRESPYPNVINKLFIIA